MTPTSKIAFYTANISNYDEVHEFFFMDPDIDYYYFTDTNKAPKGFNVVHVNSEMFPENMPNVQKARLIKANPFKYLPNAEHYDIIIWADSCFKQTKSLKELIYKMRGSDLLTMQHPDRNCIYAEANVCIEWGIGNKEATQDHYRFLASENYPPANGLAATGIMVRRNTPETKKVCRLWHEILSGNVYRDQLSFDYVCWKLNFSYNKFLFSERNNYFYNHLHLGSRL